MASAPDPDAVAESLQLGVRLIVRALRERGDVATHRDLTGPESTALSLLDRGGPATSSALAKLERISPQSMGVTVAGLLERGLIERERDATDGRRILLSVTPAGHELLRSHRSVRAKALSAALAELSPADLRTLAAAAPLMEELAGRL